MDGTVNKMVILRVTNCMVDGARHDQSCFKGVLRVVFCKYFELIDLKRKIFLSSMQELLDCTP